MTIDTYTFALGAEIVLGVPCQFEARDWTMRAFNPEHLTTNAPCAGFVRLEDMSIDGVTPKPIFYNEVGPDYYPTRDAYDFHPDVPKEKRSFERLLCDHGVHVRATYTGHVPEGLKAGQLFRFCVAVMGPG